jgi:hypothetical protein
MVLEQTFMTPQETEREKFFLASVGAALLRCQTAEQLMVVCLGRLYPDRPIQSAEMFEQMEEGLRNKTLGGLISELRKRVGLDEGFDSLLSDFLDRRNTLVHNLQRARRPGLSTPEGKAEMQDFAVRTLQKADEVCRIFATLYDAWTEQVGIHEKLRSEKPDIYDSNILVELRKTLRPHLQDLVFKKPSDPS